MNYRQIWIKHNGPIPYDSDGRRYEIHHINGDHSDNRIENLTCISIMEHLFIHAKQGDKGAVSAILKRLGEDNTEANKEWGKHTYENKIGLHSADSETRSEWGRQGALAHIGKKWFHNPITNERTRAFECPPGFKPGRGGKFGGNYNGAKRQPHSEETKYKQSKSVKLSWKKRNAKTKN